MICSGISANHALCPSASKLANHVLDSTKVQELWNDPLLRYSNLLDALFHDVTLLVESDSDCQFYAAILDVVQMELPDGIELPDIFFTHCGGKARMPMVIRALRAAGIPVRAVADFDVLREIGVFKGLVDALDGKWTEIERDYKLIKDALDSQPVGPLRSEVVSQLDAILSNDMANDG